MILGDLGAEIIKVERPGCGDDTRAWGPPFLAAVCDVLVENYLPGKLHQMGLGYEHLQAANPELVYCSISGAASSLLSPLLTLSFSTANQRVRLKARGGEPVRPGVAMTDLATGLYAHGAIMAALLQRQKTGRGVHIDCNLLHIASNYLNGGKEAQRWGTAHESIVPYQGFRTKNGFLVVAAGNDKQFAKVCQVLGLTYLAEDSNYKTNTLRVKHRTPLLQALSQRYT
ncbi:hypothetical protein NHX12_021099 [Muraenolepis orangiensis]|uniref:Succinate--hydroxymethylglutarate CoA-transferase n=1 Tax=Muraenolepis orangiensis TaxID=630683 RepID=A0A9Q0IV68_9TELE|nr:hypothetical protein NHX12_021099 [Muraenolepis orangiensis]